MRSQAVYPILAIGGLLVLILSACNGSVQPAAPTTLPAPSMTPAPTATLEPAPTQTATQLPTETFLPSETPLPSQTPTPTPPTFVRENTPVPQPVETISVVNAGRLVELARLGKGRIVDVQLSPDRNYLLVQTTIGIYGYRASTQEELWRFEDPAGIAAMAVPQTSRWIAVATNDGRIALLIYKRGSMFTRWVSGYQVINDLAFSYDGTLLAATGDRGVTVWQVGKTKTLYHYPHLVGEMVRFTPEGEEIIVGTKEEISFNEAITGEMNAEAEFSELGLPVFSDDGEYFSDGFTVWDGRTGKQIFKLAYNPIGPGQPAIAFSRDANYIAVGLVGSLEVLIWDIDQQEMYLHLESPFNMVFTDEGIGEFSRTAQPSGPGPYSIKELGFSPDGRELSVVTGLGHVEIWGAQTGRYYSRIEALGEPLYINNSRLVVWAEKVLGQFNSKTGIRYHQDRSFIVGEEIFFSNHGQLLFTGDTVWDFQYLQKNKVFKKEVILSISPDNERFYSFNPTTKSVSARAVENYELINELKLKFPDDLTKYESVDLQDINSNWEKFSVTSPRISADGKYFSGYIYDYGYFTWDLEANNVLEAIFEPGGFVASYSVSGDQLAIIGDEIILYKLFPSPKRIDSSPLEYSTYLLFSPDEKFIVSLECKNYSLHQVTDEKLQNAVVIETNVEQCFGDFATFSPSGDFLVRPYENKIVFFEWDTGDIRLSLNVHLDTVRQVAFSPDGRYLATSSHDGTVKLWGIAPEE